MVARPQFLSKYSNFFLQTLRNRPLHIVAIRWLITKNVDSFGMPYPGGVLGAAALLLKGGQAEGAGGQV